MKLQFGNNKVPNRRITASVFGTKIDAKNWDCALAKINTWASHNESRYVCICNVHSVVTASQDRVFSQIINESDMATPDGAPVAWMLRRMGHIGQKRINGPDLMWRYCNQAQVRSESIFFYGSAEKTLISLEKKLRLAFPALKIAGSISPPFRVLTTEEDETIVKQINNSGANVVFVSLGCPKQELWMAAHRGRINAVMIGVGAAFDYHAGTIKRAPLWMQHHGLEWFYRLATEPRRLWRRYLVTNTLFIALAAKQLLCSNRVVAKKNSD
jgi:N-acetylglucosaminyldiphosphoundecaprenol N-acetyl-beta-D-mannosaminyltransferase